MIDNLTKNTTATQVLSLANQSIATLILVFFGWMLAAKGPLILENLRAGYDRNAQQLQEASVRFEATTDRLIRQLIDDRKLMIDLARETHESAESIRRAVEPAEPLP
tara:strand:+ start:192 stop:512 length:321 start_codon:yes stop_codon:yes gene_type:complete